MYISRFLPVAAIFLATYVVTFGQLTEDIERINNLLAEQRNIAVNGKINVRYLVCGKQSLPKPEAEEFVDQLISVATSDPTVDTVESFIRSSFPGRRQYWRDVELTFEGKRSRAELNEIPGNEHYNGNTVKTVSDGSTSARYKVTSRQVTVMSSNKSGSFKRFMFSDVLLVPQEEITEQHARKENGFLTFEYPSGRSRLNLSNGMIHSIVDDDRKRYQLAFRQFDHVWLPQVRIDVDYRNESLYRFSTVIIQEASFNRSLREDFKLEVPEGTVIADARLGMDNIVPTRAQSKIADVMTHVGAMSDPQPSPSQDRKSTFSYANAIAIITLTLATIYLWRRSSAN